MAGKCSKHAYFTVGWYLYHVALKQLDGAAVVMGTCLSENHLEGARDRVRQFIISVLKCGIRLTEGERADWPLSGVGMEMYYGKEEVMMAAALALHQYRFGNEFLVIANNTYSDKEEAFCREMFGKTRVPEKKNHDRIGITK